MGAVDVLKAAQHMERRGRDYYLLHLSGPLTTLAGDEDKHVGTIGHLYESLREGETWPAVPEDVLPPTVIAQAVDYIVDAGGAGFTSGSALKEVYEHAYDFERRALEFYTRAARESTDPKLVQFLKFLANVEQLHVAGIKRLLMRAEGNGETV